MRSVMPAELARVLGASDAKALDDAWAAFVAKYTRLLLHVARSAIADREGAMDAYAVVLERLREDDHRRLRAHAADGRGKFITWLVVVVRRMCLDHERHRFGRAPRGVDESSAREERLVRRRLLNLASTSFGLELLASDEHEECPSPERALRERELHVALDGALSLLDPRDRLLLALRFGDELSASRIAKLVSLPTPFHVYRRLRQVLEALRAHLDSPGVVCSSP